MTKRLLICILLSLFAGNARAEERPFKVGFILALTGAWADFGEAQKNALELARLDAPGVFRKIQFVYEDGGHQADRTLAAYRKLRTQDNVNIVFTWGVQPAEILAPIAERDKLPLLVSAQVAHVAKGRRYVTRTINYSQQYSQKLIEFARHENKRQMALVMAQMSFYQLLADGISNNLRTGEALTVLESISPDASDFRTIVAKAKKAKFDWLGLYLTPPQILEFLAQASEQQLHAQFFGATPFQSDSLIKQAKGALEGAIYVHNMVTHEFRSHYSEQFGNDHQIPWAANAYDAANLIGGLFSGESNGSMAAESVVSKIASITEGTGVGGHYVMRDDPETGRYLEYPLAVYRIVGGKHVVMWQ